MKKGKAFFLLFCLCLISPAAFGRESPERALFVSVIQNPPVLTSREAVEELIGFAERARTRTLFVQIYRANKSWFPSKIADDWSYQAAVKKVSEDPFQFLIGRAHASGIEVHAWLNMLSLNENIHAKLLKKYGASILTRNLNKKKTVGDYKIDGQYFLEPGDLRVRKELSDLVAEILERYPELDGIQFDYIRYPDKNPFYGYTKDNIRRFKEETGQKKVEEKDPLWKDWRRAQVTECLKTLTGRARSIRPKIKVSATACAPYVRAYQEAFQDWPGWLGSGLVDFVTLMSYSTDRKEFEKDISDAKKKSKDFGKINIGIGAYKMRKSPETFTLFNKLCEESGCRSCVIFHYGSLLENPALSESLLAEA